MNRRDKAYSTYVKKYKELTKKRPDMYGKIYSRSQFFEKYDAAKLKGKKNPARAVALDQREWTYNFERSFYKITGYKVTGKEMTNKQLEEYEEKFGPTVQSTKTREDVFLDFYDQMKAENPKLTHDEIEAAFEALY